MEKEKQRASIRGFGCRRLFWSACTALGLMCSLPFILTAPELHWHLDDNIRRPIITPEPASRTSDMIAFICERRDNSRRGALYTIHPDGSHLNQIRARPYESYRYLNWSPDGTWLAFVATNHYLTMLPEEKYEIYRVRFDGLDSRRLTYNRIIEVAPIWSHDGQSIIFFNDQTIHFISADGDEISRTYNNTVSHFRSSPRGRRRIDWSSDGTRIIAKGYYDAILYGRNPNGSDMQVLTKAGMNTTALAWASNDEQILYYSNDVSFDFSKLVVFDIKDNVEQISLKMDLVVHALWSPDSRWIAIRGRALGLKEGMHIYLLNVETGDIQHKTTMSTGDFGSISWSPDSKWIAYTTNPRSGGNSRIFKMERDSASTQQLIEIDCRITEISWSPT